jgi:hypothetical protein
MSKKCPRKLIGLWAASVGPIQLTLSIDSVNMFSEGTPMKTLEKTALSNIRCCLDLSRAESCTELSWGWELTRVVLQRGGILHDGRWMSRQAAVTEFERARAAGEPALLVENLPDSRIRVRSANLDLGGELQMHARPSSPGPEQVESAFIVSNTRPPAWSDQIGTEELMLRVVQGVRDTFRMDDERKKSLALEVAASLLADQGVHPERLELEQLLTKAAGSLDEIKKGCVPRARLMAPNTAAGRGPLPDQNS